MPRSGGRDVAPASGVKPFESPKVENPDRAPCGRNKLHGGFEKYRGRPRDPRHRCGESVYLSYTVKRLPPMVLPYKILGGALL